MIIAILKREVKGEISEKNRTNNKKAGIDIDGGWGRYLYEMNLVFIEKRQ